MISSWVHGHCAGREAGRGRFGLLALILKHILVELDKESPPGGVLFGDARLSEANCKDYIKQLKEKVVISISIGKEMRTA